MSKFIKEKLFPILTVSVSIILLWYAFSIVLNSKWADDKAIRADKVLSFKELVLDTWSQKKPKLPTPLQVFIDMIKSFFHNLVTS